MRIVQIIDSLEAGGAERMAVNYANALSDKIAFSGLIATRSEGSLLKQLNKKVFYQCLHKKNTVDFKAILKLRAFVRQHKVTYIQAHSSSFFIAVLLKCLQPRIKIIWHDHYGNSEYLENRPYLNLRIAKYFFSGIITVNEQLENWVIQKLHFKKVIYLPNFTIPEKEIEKKTILRGIDGKRIICLANLRLQKDHFLLLEVAKLLKLSHPEWSFHLVGKNFNDSYAVKVNELIVKYNLENAVFLYGTRQDVLGILDQSTIAILTSESEGLPVALLEYGKSKKPVITTNVGQISSVIKDGINGFLVASKQDEIFHEKLVELIENELLRNTFANTLHETVIENFSEENILEKYLNWLLNTKQ